MLTLLITLKKIYKTSVPLSEIKFNNNKINDILMYGHKPKKKIYNMKPNK